MPAGAVVRSETLISAKGQNVEWCQTAVPILSKCVASIGPLIADAAPATLSVATSVPLHASGTARKQKRIQTV